MYILAQNGPLGPILLGVFSNKQTLNMGIKAVKTYRPDVSKIYYQEIGVDNFDSTLIQFFTMHSEKLE